MRVVICEKVIGTATSIIIFHLRIIVKKHTNKTCDLKNTRKHVYVFVHSYDDLCVVIYYQMVCYMQHIIVFLQIFF